MANTMERAKHLFTHRTFHNNQQLTYFKISTKGLHFSDACVMTMQLHKVVTLGKCKPVRWACRKRMFQGHSASFLDASREVSTLAPFRLPCWVVGKVPWVESLLEVAWCGTVGPEDPA